VTLGLLQIAGMGRLRIVKATIEKESVRGQKDLGRSCGSGNSVLGRFREPAVSVEGEQKPNISP
jgi:hypothetical protein